MSDFKTYREYWVENHVPSFLDGCEATVLAPRVTCADGFNISIQASCFHYCSPKEYLKDGNYLSWELAFPTKEDDSLAEYAQDASRPLDTVYGYVPTEVVEALVEKHGGIA